MRRDRRHLALDVLTTSVDWLILTFVTCAALACAAFAVVWAMSSFRDHSVMEFALVAMPFGVSLFIGAAARLLWLEQVRRVPRLGRVR
jgi:undecaprenyl pyrophosphate phosphatase UppP